MAILPIVNIGLKGFAAFWSLVTWAVAASEVDRLGGFANRGNYAGASVILAAGLLAMLYFIAAVVLIFIAPASFLISLIVDISVLSFLFILALAGSAALSTKASVYSGCSGWDVCNLGSATIGLGWVLTFLLLGILLFEIIYTVKNFGTSYATWRTPFNELLQYGPSEKRTTSANTEAANATTAPATTSAEHGYATQAPAAPTATA